ncbi:MAG: dihydrolipoyllysine-residue acetyltransferase [Halothiobacillaceae bacterium]|nr:dihydrolipoyllysine-residue acetyltransferase [Halothiobacillaceae bacterium]MDY0050511.1 dihydrolipoyllysine-residue acetyltransferase [Halothiobacillaceae bacterium]
MRGALGPGAAPHPRISTSTGSTMAIKQILLPDVGNYSNIPVIEVLVSEGDVVNVDDSLITLESDKATMEIPSPYQGVIQKVLVKVGDKVHRDQPILEIEVKTTGPNDVPAEKPADKPAPAAAASPAQAAARPEPQASAVATVNLADLPVNAQPMGASFHASPSVRAYARKLGVDLSRVSGSGAKGRILESDVDAHVKDVMEGRSAPPTLPAASSGLGIPPVPVIDFSPFGEIEEQALSRIKKLSGKHLSACWLNVPHVTQFDEADITELEAFRQSLKAQAEKEGVRVTPLAFIMKAVSRVLREYPQFNASLDASGEKLILKKYINLGIAVETPGGLVVPVVRDVDGKGVFDLSRELMELSKRARDGKLSPQDMSGGSFSISSLGGIGGTQFTPIVNAPEVAILGVSRSKMQPVWNGKEFTPRLMLPLALSYDHRVIDGAEGARFTTRLSALLSDLRQLVL